MFLTSARFERWQLLYKCSFICTCVLLWGLFLLHFSVDVSPLFSCLQFVGFLRLWFVTRIYFLSIDLCLLNSGILLVIIAITQANFEIEMHYGIKLDSNLYVLNIQIRSVVNVRRKSTINNIKNKVNVNKCMQLSSLHK